MITDKDRSYYFGASDTKYVMGNWNTKTFEKWWREKQGIYQSNFTNEAMQAGNAYEHKILDSLGIWDLEKDKQIIIGRLRVNLDGNTSTKIYEVKTYNVEKKFKVSKAYKQQVLVQMYASGIYEACIVAYGLEPEDYSNYFRPIDHNRLSFHEIEYDSHFITLYRRRLDYLSMCLDEGIFPDERMVS